MLLKEELDVLILGSGQGGKLLAWSLAKEGKKVAVVERQWVGGSCPAVACLPSKNEIWSARVAHITKNAAKYGTVTGLVKTDMKSVKGRKQGMIDREIDFHLNAYKESGAELIMGSGRFIALNTLEVALNNGGTRLLSGKEVVINVGSHAFVPDIPGLAESKRMTHIEALELDYYPSHVIILGGGYIGVEMAQTYRRFGSFVTIIENGPRLMSREDSDVSETITEVLVDEGISVIFNAQIEKVEGQSGSEVSVTVKTSSGIQVIEGSDLLIATGRVPNTANIGLENTGVEVDARGYIKVNDKFQATAKNIWAIGECAGSPQFTHVSVDDFRIVKDAMSGGSRSKDDRLIPYVMFTDPPLARVGISESDANKFGIPVRVAKIPMSNVLRTAATDETVGFMKVLINSIDDSILGFTMIGSEAGEVMATVQTAMIGNIPFTKLRDAVYTHLTMAEGLGPLLGKVPERS